MRKYYIDNSRWITIVLVVIYHVFYMFNSVITEGVIGPVTSAHWQDHIQYILYPWFMVILFIVSGMCARYYLDSHTVKEFIRARTRKLLVPSTIGVFVFGWIQGYFNMAFSGAFHNLPETLPPVVSYLIMSVSGIGVLWTIQVMWIFSIILILIRKIEKGRLRTWGKKINIIWLLLLGIPVWAAAQVLNTPVICVYRFGIYGFCFLLGYYVFSHDEVTDILKKYCIPLLAAAAVLGTAYTVIYYGQDYAKDPTVNCPLAIAYAWIACLALIGCVKRWYDRTDSLSAFMTGKSFGLYIFHYLALSIAAYVLTRYTHMNGVGIYVLSAAAAFAGGILLYEIISRIPFLRWCTLGIKRRNKCLKII